MITYKNYSPCSLLDDSFVNSSEDLERIISHIEAHGYISAGVDMGSERSTGREHLQTYSKKSSRYRFGDWFYRPDEEDIQSSNIKRCATTESGSAFDEKKIHQYLALYGY